MDALFALCNICGGSDLHAGLDGFFYCSTCGSQSQQFQEQALDHDQVAGYTRCARRADVPATTAEETAMGAAGTDPIMEQVAPIFLQDQLGLDESAPWDMGFQQNMRVMRGAYKPEKQTDPMENLDKTAASVRNTYIQGLQEIIKMQCEALVKQFEVTPLVWGIVGPIWLRFLVFTCVYHKDWPKEVIQIQEARNEERKKKCKKRRKVEKEEGEEETRETQDELVRVRMGLHLLFLEALKERIPLSVSLAVTFLACHIAQEAILPTDLVQWALDGNLPYLNAFHQLEKKAGFDWPIEARLMLRPIDVIGARKLEFMAATIAKRIGLELPPVNFSDISARFLKQLNLPVDELSIYISRIKDWYTPPGLWLSEEVHALPSRIYVMAMIVIVLRIIYQFDGRWYWETPTAESGVESDHSTDPWSAKNLLEKLEEMLHNQRPESFEIEKHLDPYLKYCHDFIFTGLKLENEEEQMCDQLWKLYEQPPKKDPPISKETERVKMPEAHNSSVNDRMPLCMGVDSEVSSFNNAQPNNAFCASVNNDDKVYEQTSPDKKFRSLIELIYDIEELGFSYLPPRRQSLDQGKYLRYYVKKSKGGNAPQLLHADYFILLCACAKVITAHPLALYRCVQRLERRLVHIEKEVQRQL